MPGTVGLNQNTFELTYQIETGLILLVCYLGSHQFCNIWFDSMIYTINLLQGKRNGFIF
jgi:hypothetical protein